MLETELVFALNAFALNSIVSSTCAVLASGCVPEIVFVVDLIALMTKESTHRSIRASGATTVWQAN